MCASSAMARRSACLSDEDRAASALAHWTEREIDVLAFKDARLGRRFAELLMHSSLAVTTAGLPLGLAAVKFWTRKKFKGTARLKNRRSI